jgi:hypothetical protein
VTHLSNVGFPSSPIYLLDSITYFLSGIVASSYNNVLL